MSFVDSHDLPCDDCRAKLTQLDVCLVPVANAVINQADGWSMPLRAKLVDNKDGTAELFFQSLAGTRVWTLKFDGSFSGDAIDPAEDDIEVVEITRDSAVV